MSKLVRTVAALACLLLYAAVCEAGETPETILIRKTMATDLSGHHRGDADLVLSTYDKTFVELDGHGNADPRAWTIRFSTLDQYAKSLAQDLATHRYETGRTVQFLQVRGDQAMVTSQDSGQVVDRASGVAHSILVRRFWILRKNTETWRIVTLVDALGDTLLPVPAVQPPASELVDFLTQEAAAWNASKPGDIVGHFDEHFMGCDAYDTCKPETWKIIFNGTKEFKAFLTHRLDATRYQISRQVLSTNTSADGREAVALTHEAVRVSHLAGDVVHELDRNVLWLLSRSSGSWKATTMCYGVALGD